MDERQSLSFYRNFTFFVNRKKKARNSENLHVTAAITTTTKNIACL